MPAVIRSSADWQGKKTRKKKHKRSSSSSKNKTFHGGVLEGSIPECVDFQDVWCGPGIGFSTDAAAAASVDCVVARKNVSSARGKIDVDKITHREVFSFLQCLIFIPNDLVPKSVEKFSFFFFFFYLFFVCSYTKNKVCFLSKTCINEFSIFNPAKLIFCKH